jgi:hypothetical protein
LLDTDDGRRILADSIKGALPLSRFDLPFTHDLAYLDRLRNTQWKPVSKRPIFITARFRTGSTLLWNLFRQMEGVTAYYEPLNERRWFDPAMRGDRIDGTHRGVTDYWKEYVGLEVLTAYYQESWIRRRLLMDGHDWDPALKRYVDILLECAPKRPVLQFNRIDFRLPWFRRNFPDAIIVHLTRHPRDQWCSVLMDTRAYPSNSNPRDFVAHDHFYQQMWAEDLQYHFPFLANDAVEHPYQQFYYLWTLSYLFGMKYADYSLTFDDLVARPRHILNWLIDELALPAQNMEHLVALVDAPATGRWKSYADDEWFIEHEAKCDVVLAEFFKSSASRQSVAAAQRPARQGAVVISASINAGSQNLAADLDETHSAMPQIRLPAMSSGS